MSIGVLRMSTQYNIHVEIKNKNKKAKRDIWQLSEFFLNGEVKLTKKTKLLIHIANSLELKKQQ